MNRQERAKKAQEHYEDIKVRLSGNTEASVLATKIYGPQPPAREEPNKRERIDHDLRLVDLDSVSALFEDKSLGKTCILNYASYKNPGGFFLGGSAAQEEALCHESNLYPILLSFDGSYYDWNRGRLNKALYLDRALYTPNVIFEQDGITKVADVLTCAAPNFKTAHRYQNVSREENRRIFSRRIHFMLRIAEENKVDTLITGAWGCGVFGQDPYETCELMTDAIVFYRYKISNIVYAIPGVNSANFLGFQNFLDNYDGSGRPLVI